MKKLILSSDVLKHAFKKLGQAVNEKSVMPILRNIYCKVTKNQLEMYAHDQEITICYRCDVATPDEFEMLIPFSYINQALGLMAHMPITIEHPSTRKARIIAGDDVYELNSLEKVEDYPNLPALPKKFLLQTDEHFIGVITSAMLTCSKDNSKPELTNAILDVSNGTSCVVSMDGTSMFKHNLKLESAEAQQLEFTDKLVKAIEGMDKPQINWNSKTVCIHTEKLTVWGIRFNVKYPDYKRVIPNYPITMEVEKTQLVHALKRSCLNGSEIKEVKVFLTQEKGFVHYEAHDKERGRRMPGKIPADFTGTVETIVFNAKRFLTMMDQVKAEKLCLHIMKEDKPVLISTEEDADYLGMIMPIQN